MSGFKFGATGGLFGSQPATTTTASTGFSFGTTSAAASTTQSSTGSFSFGQPSTTSTAPSGFSFGTPAGTSAGSQTSSNASTKPASSGFTFGATPANTASTGAAGGLKLGGATGAGTFSFGTPASSTATSQPAAGGFAFGARPPAPAAATATTGGLSLGVTSATITQPAAPTPGTTTGLSGLSAAGVKPGTGFGALAALVQTTKAATASTQAAGLNLGGTVSAGVVSKPSTTSTGFQLGGSSSAPTAALNIKTSTATTIAPTPQSSTITTSTSGSSAAAASSVTTTTTAATSSAAVGPSMTYKELEDQMNKWWVELETQEKVFLEQATRVNAWDKLLVENGQKITDLNDNVKKVKSDQDRLNHELDFIVAQQKELEEMLEPLEKSVAKLPPINYQQHTDTEREKTYQIAENIDAQLKRMTEDLKEVIEHLNTASGTQDSSDPMLQISKILNAHMESLQWIDRSAATLQSKMDQVSRYADQSRKEHERSIRLAYS